MALIRGKYYQRSVRRNGRIITLFYGADDDARFLAGLDVLFRQERDEARQEARALNDEQRRRYEAERDFSAAIRGLLVIYLEAGGFRRQQRRRWRRRRMGPMQALPTPRDDEAIRAEMRELVARVGEHRDLAAVDRLAALAKEHPQTAREVIRCDLPRFCRENFASNLFTDEQDHAPSRNGFIARMEMKVKELCGEDPSEEVRCCAEVAAYEWGYHWMLVAVGGSKSIFQDEHPKLTRRCNAASRRLRSSLKDLAQIKALQRPRPPVVVATQVNIAHEGGTADGSAASHAPPPAARRPSRHRQG
jgi:hypothetical protein